LIFLLACGATTSGPPPVAPPVATPLVEESGPSLRERTTWMGVYLRDKKIGWSRSSIEKIDPTRYRLRNETFMRLEAMGAVHETTMELSVDFTPTYDPLAFRFSLVTPASSSTAEGEVQGGVLVTRMKTPQSESEKRIPLDGNRDLFGLAELRRAAEGYKVGDVFEGEVFEPTVFGVAPYRLEVLDSNVVRIGAAEETVFRIKMTMAGIESISVVNADGEIIRSDGPMGITMKREDERSARDLGQTGNVTDLILAFAIDAETVIASPGRIRRAVMEVTGLETGLAAGGVQRVSDPDSNGVRIVTVDLGRSERTTQVEAAPWLLPGERVQSDDPRIRARAREIIGEAGSWRQKAKRLFDWVHGNMRQQSAFTLPSAVDVLETMSGDCNEHAVLLTALARAAGIPARDAVGVAYHQGRFYYHAWNELWLDGYWYPVDATFNERPAGALRVRLAVGDLAEQMRIATMAGRIRIRVKEASE
jgi:hypothetical protein